MRKANAPAPMQSARATAPPSRPKDETTRLGKEIYERDIRPQVEADHYGDVVAIDVDSGNWPSAMRRLKPWPACAPIAREPLTSCA